MDSSIPRRAFLDRIVQWTSALLGLGALGAIVGYLYPPVLRRRGAPVTVAKVGELRSGEVKAFDFHGEPAMLIQRADGPAALSLTCTHLGCSVRWQDEIQRFVCPCHKGVFDAAGAVLSGPPPSPLERLPVRVRGNSILAG